MIGHLGARVSALLDGQLPAPEAERAWQHVQICSACRDLVEREAWVKRRLARLTGSAPASEDLKGQLKGPRSAPSDLDLSGLQPTGPGNRRHALGLVALGGGAAGAAVVGVLALGTAPADAPAIVRPAPSPQPVVHPVSPTATNSPARPWPAAEFGRGPVATGFRRAR